MISIELAKKLIDEAKEVEADVIKFQTFKSEKNRNTRCRIGKIPKEDIKKSQI